MENVNKKWCEVCICGKCEFNKDGICTALDFNEPICGIWCVENKRFMIKCKMQEVCRQVVSNNEKTINTDTGTED